jgi:hypothetical protein
MIKNGTNTLTGLDFEEKVDFPGLLRGLEDYTDQNSATKAGAEVFFNGKHET